MNILIIGSGAREHAIAKSLHASRHNPVIYCCGTASNPGIQQLCKAYWVGDITDLTLIAELARQWQINIAIIGPEAPLECGLADRLWDEGIAVIGPKKKLAQVETSKGFTRDLMHKYNIPGLPRYQKFYNHEGVADFLNDLGETNYVIKADGLMSGKGVKVAGDHLHSFAEALIYCDEIFNQGQSLVIEEKLIGQEFSFMCFSDGNSLSPMPLIQDHKRAYINDQGPNTGGMGSYSDADHSLPFLTAIDVQQAFHINQLVINSLMAEIQDKYVGILYGGFIATARGVFVIEFNARFGDPEALNVLSILESDFVDVCVALTTGTLASCAVQFSKKATVCKYAVPEGYPDNPLRDIEIHIDDVEDKELLYLAAVNATEQGLLATGSRTAACVGIADTIAGAEQIAEGQISCIKGQLFHRVDIGTTALVSQRVAAMHELRSL